MAGTYAKSAVEQMMGKAMSARGVAELLWQGVIDGAFYIKGYDSAQPRELLHAMLQARTDDIVQARPALSHLVRDENGKRVRKQIGAAMQGGVVALKARAKL